MSEDYYYLHDHLKSPVALLDIDGEVLERYEYDAYGRPTLWQGDYNYILEGPSWYNNPYYFTGRRLDVIENGTWMIQYHRGRFLDYYTGCWLNQDPIGYQDGPNLYAYVNSNPINKTDPFGEWTKDGVSRILCFFEVGEQMVNLLALLDVDSVEEQSGTIIYRDKDGNIIRQDVIFEGGFEGRYPPPSLLELNSSLDDCEAAGVIAHELTHFLQFDQRRNLSRGEAELQAFLAEERFRLEYGMPPLIPGCRTGDWPNVEIDIDCVKKYVYPLYGISDSGEDMKRIGIENLYPEIPQREDVDGWSCDRINTEIEPQCYFSSLQELAIFANMWLLRPPE